MGAFNQQLIQVLDLLAEMDPCSDIEYAVQVLHTLAMTNGEEIAPFAVRQFKRLVEDFAIDIDECLERYNDGADEFMDRAELIEQFYEEDLYEEVFPTKPHRCVEVLLINLAMLTDPSVDDQTKLGLFLGQLFDFVNQLSTEA